MVQRGKVVRGAESEEPKNRTEEQCRRKLLEPVMDGLSYGPDTAIARGRLLLRKRRNSDRWSSRLPWAAMGCWSFIENCA